MLLPLLLARDVPASSDAAWPRKTRGHPLTRDCSRNLDNGPCDLIEKSFFWDAECLLMFSKIQSTPKDDQIFFFLVGLRSFMERHPETHKQGNNDTRVMSSFYLLHPQ